MSYAVLPKHGTPEWKNLLRVVTIGEKLGRLEDTFEVLQMLGLAEVLLEPELQVPYPEVGPRTKELKPCGTYAAYMRHRKRGEKPCQPCVDGWLEKRRLEQRRLAYRKKLVSLRKRGLLHHVGDPGVDDGHGKRVSKKPIKYRIE